jgi:hypothetical protein
MGSTSHAESRSMSGICVAGHNCMNFESLAGSGRYGVEHFDCSVEVHGMLFHCIAWHGSAPCKNHDRSFAVRLRSRNLRKRSGDDEEGWELSSSSQLSSLPIKSNATSPRTFMVLARRLPSSGVSRSDLPNTIHSARHRVSAKHASHPSMSLIAFCIFWVACKNAAVAASSSLLCATSFSLHATRPCDPHATPKRPSVTQSSRTLAAIRANAFMRSPARLRALGSIDSPCRLASVRAANGPLHTPRSRRLWQ